MATPDDCRRTTSPGFAISRSKDVENQRLAETQSRPSRARGLKHEAIEAAGERLWSRPSRARGLKHPAGTGLAVVDGRAPRGRVG